MLIGLTYDLKECVPKSHTSPDDSLEEYDSPETVDAIESVLRSQGHEVVKLGGGSTFLKNVLNNRADIVFNISEGIGNYRSREAQVPAILEMLNIRYTGSDPQCLAICLDKNLTKKLVSSEGIRTPEWFLVSTVDDLSRLKSQHPPFPVFIKPAYEGSSKGIRLGSKVNNMAQASELALRLLEDYHQPIIIERFIPGDEITVGVIGNTNPQIVGIMRVLARQTPSTFIYSLEVKRNWENLVDYECPAKLKKSTLNEIAELSLHAFKILGCRDFARIDFRLDPNNLPWFLEINPLPGLNPYSSDLPIMVKKMGWQYEKLILSTLNAAIERYAQCVHA